MTTLILIECKSNTGNFNVVFSKEKNIQHLSHIILLLSQQGP